jgi:glycosyltransferase involved in cell wall biosynthesis
MGDTERFENLSLLATIFSDNKGMKNIDLSIVVPFYNEAKNVHLVIDAYKDYSKKYSFELICVNNGSTDDTSENLQKYKKLYSFIKIVTVKKNMGYGYGIMQGVESAKGDIIAWTHADMQTDAKDVFTAYEKYKRNKGNIIIKGKRVKRPVSQYLFSLGMSVIASILLNKIFYEINAQPKLFPKSFLKYMENYPHDFSLDLFFLYQAKKYKYQVKTIDVYFRKRIHGESKWAYSFASKWKTIKRTLSYMFKLREIIT